MAKIVELIYTTERVGEGKAGDPVRNVHQLWTKDGKLVVSYDRYSLECDTGDVLFDL